MIKFSLTKEFLFLLLVAAVSAAIRLHINFSTDYTPGNNGAYYLIMVRSLLENGKLIRADFPLLFWLEAGISFIVIKLGLANLNSAIDMTSRVFDSIVPTLAIIPAYLLIKKLLFKDDKWFSKVLISSISILYYSFLVLVSDFQKNALGLLWLFWMIYFLLLVHEEASKKNIIGVFIFLLFTGLTHYGCIAVGITIIIIDFLCRHFFGYSLKKFLKLSFWLLISTGASIALMYLINPWRVRTFIEIPFQIFNDPVLFKIINKEPIITPPDILSMVLMNCLGAIAFFQFIKKYDCLQKNYRLFYLSMIILLLFLASPFLAFEYAQRVYFISYLAAIPVVTMIYNLAGAKQKIYSSLVSAVILCSVIISVIKPAHSNMNKRLYRELLQIKNYVNINSTDVIIARHGMEFWSTWIMNVDAFRQESTWPGYWKMYTNVYVLHQKKDKSPFGPAGIYGKPFHEPQLPEGSYLVYNNEFFDLYRSPKPPEDFKKYNSLEF